MKFNLSVVGVLVAAIAQFAPLTSAQEVDGSDINQQLTEREGKINRLTIDEQLKLRAAQKKAVEDPDVKAALEKRNQAIEEFRAALHKSMVKSDPTLEAILQKIAVGVSPGF
jgi:hypothetical protein